MSEPQLAHPVARGTAEGYPVTWETAGSHVDRYRT
jgi:hypothetical protein